MTDKLKELEKEAVAEDKYTDNAAFELFVKDMIRLDLESIAKAYRNLSRMQKVKDVHTLQYYEEEFVVERRVVTSKARVRFPTSPQVLNKKHDTWHAP